MNWKPFETAWLEFVRRITGLKAGVTEMSSSRNSEYDQPNA